MIGTNFRYWLLWYDCGRSKNLMKRCSEGKREPDQIASSEWTGKLDWMEKFPIDQSWSLETGKHGHKGHFSRAQLNSFTLSSCSSWTWPSGKRILWSISLKSWWIRSVSGKTIYGLSGPIDDPCVALCSQGQPLTDVTQNSALYLLVTTLVTGKLGPYSQQV